MTETVENAKPKAAVKAKPAATNDVKPVLALHQIRYGDKKVAAAGSFFTPPSAADRAEWIEMGIVRELDEVEAVVAAQMAPTFDEDALG